MASQGPVFFPTWSTSPGDPSELHEWVNPGNAASNDASEATITAATYDANVVSKILVGTGSSFSIPAGATIDGMEITIRRRRIVGGAVDHRVALWDTGVGAVGTNQADTVTAWPTTSTDKTYGSPTSGNLGYAGLTVTKLNTGVIGVALSVTATVNNTDIGVDSISLTVYYTTAGSATGSGSPVATLSPFTSSATAVLTFNASGSPTKTLSATASGTATMTTDPSTGSGSPVATLSPFTTGATAVLKFNASGAPVATLSPTASGTAVQTFNASGTPTATLSATASGTATMTPDVGGPPPVVGSGSPVATLSATASGTATMTPDPSTGSGAAMATLHAFANGTAHNGAAPPPKKARGLRFVKFDEEKQEEEKQELEPEVVEARPLPPMIEIPAVELVELDREGWQRALAVTQPIKARPKLVPVETDEDAEILETLLDILVLID